MLRIAIASGKGGTGKTTVATSLALLLARTSSVHFLDCDVEAPNAALFLRPDVSVTGQVTRPVPAVDESVCNHCGECSAACRFHAIAATATRVLVFPEICHGCGGCVRACPEGAISERARAIGEIEEGVAGAIRFTHGMLRAGETATVPLIRAVRRRESAAEVVIVDCPPGASCPAVAAVEGADRVVLVTEPTPFGLHDLAVAIDMTRRLGLRAGVVINRDGLGDGRIDSFCASAGIPILGRIADDRRVAEVYSGGESPLAVSSFRGEMTTIAECLASGVRA
jgi:MinD superfamily P-loop ATPase